MHMYMYVNNCIQCLMSRKLEEHQSLGENELHVPLDYQTYNVIKLPDILPLVL